MTRLGRQDLAWAGFILALAVLFGLIQQWPLVTQAWRGELAAKLAQARDRARHSRFQGIKTIDLAQAYAKFKEGRALFIDARAPAKFDELHIPKALNLSPSMLEAGGAAKLAGVPKSREIVVYCDEINCNLALKVAEKLEKMGYRRVAAFMGGFRDWDQAGYPADTNR
jgi:rhodanese-related sulfurtransferase